MYKRQGKRFFNQKTVDSYEKREKKSIESLVGKRFDTTVGWSGESDSIFKLKLAGVLFDGDTDNSSDNASADTSYDSACLLYTSQQAWILKLDRTYISAQLRRMSFI